MASNVLIKQVAYEFGWSQADVKRAIDASQDEVTTKDEVIQCMVRYAGPTLLDRIRVIGNVKRVSNQQKETIRNLVEQLTNVQGFYAAQLVPTLKATIDAQATYIADLLRQVSGKNQGGSNGQ